MTRSKSRYRIQKKRAFAKREASWSREFAESKDADITAYDSPAKCEHRERIANEFKALQDRQIMGKFLFTDTDHCRMIDACTKAEIDQSLLVVCNKNKEMAKRIKNKHPDIDVYCEDVIQCMDKAYWAGVWLDVDGTMWSTKSQQWTGLPELLKEPIPDKEKSPINCHLLAITISSMHIGKSVKEHSDGLAAMLRDRGGTKVESAGYKGRSQKMHMVFAMSKFKLDKEWFIKKTWNVSCLMLQKKFKGWLPTGYFLRDGALTCIIDHFINGKCHLQFRNSQGYLYSNMDSWKPTFPELCKFEMKSEDDNYIKAD